VSYPANKISLTEFLHSFSNHRHEFLDGMVSHKLLPPYKIAYTCGGLLKWLRDWSTQQQSGRVCLQRSLLLQRQGQVWVPVPELIYISSQRLPQQLDKDEHCSVPPELVVEVISAEHSFSETIQKVTDYLIAGVDRVWVIDIAGSVTVFAANELPQTFGIDDTISDVLLPGLTIPVADLFETERSPNADQNQ